jgi:sortase A
MTVPSHPDDTNPAGGNETVKVLFAAVVAIGLAGAAGAQLVDDADSATATPWIRPDHCPPDAPPPELSARAIGWLLLPRFGLRVPVFEGVDLETLKIGAGHVSGTARMSNPGRYRNCVLAAHRTSFFGPLESVQPGDGVILVTANGMQDFEVTRSYLVEPNQAQVAAPSAQPQLTLVTCFPFNYLGSAPQRFIVEARPLTEPPGPPDPP